MKLPADAIILETQCMVLTDGSWGAFIRFKTPNQGGYDRPPHDDMFRVFRRGKDGLTIEQRARAWLADKLANREGAL